MGFEYISILPTPDEIKEQLPLAPALAAMKAKRDQEIRDVFTGNSDKFLVIVGPCSADREDSVCDYVNRLTKVQEQVKDRLILIPRIYTNKPRTTGDGYKGMVHQPDPEKKPNLYEGIIAIRKLHIRVTEETGLTTACLLYTSPPASRSGCWSSPCRPPAGHFSASRPAGPAPRPRRRPSRPRSAAYSR